MLVGRPASTQRVRGRRVRVDPERFAEICARLEYHRLDADSDGVRRAIEHAEIRCDHGGAHDRVGTERGIDRVARRRESVVVRADDRCRERDERLAVRYAAVDRRVDRAREIDGLLVRLAALTEQVRVPRRSVEARVVLRDTFVATSSTCARVSASPGCVEKSMNRCVV